MMPLGFRGPLYLSGGGKRIDLLKWGVAVKHASLWCLGSARGVLLLEVGVGASR
ncbi:MAG TPA: hypothetical protein ACQGQF_03730 [Xylella fastidiosa subsp. pauca]|uniref:hypothetical protein n=2 Tax=Xylella fastidiosa TaxID=2371 RepID=UPI000AF0BEA4|nr:hypothetical protein [Xylella fastidiosa]